MNKESPPWRAVFPIVAVRASDGREWIRGQGVRIAWTDCPKCGDDLVAKPSWRGLGAGDPVRCAVCGFRGELDGDEDGWSVREVTSD